MQLTLTPPHCGELNNLIVRSQRAADLHEDSRSFVSWDLTPRQLCDLELLLNGAFSPLRGFMTREDYDGVCSQMRLANGGLWPIPITLDVSEEFAGRLGLGDKVALRDPEGVMLAVLHVEDVWRPDREAEAQLVYGTTNSEHPGVNHLLNRTQPWFVGGHVEGLQLPTHYDFNALRLTPAELRDEFERLDWTQVVAFQTRNPMHRAHFELTLRAVNETGAKLLVHPSVGMTKPGDVDHYTRIRCYQHIMDHYPRDTAKLSLLPLAMRMAGPREAMWHAIIRKNYGCSHIIVGRDHAGPGKDSAGKPFYGPYEAQELLATHEEELEIQAVPFQSMVFVERERSYFPQDQVTPDERVLDISGTELRQRLAAGKEIPEWFTFPEVATELRRTHPPRHKQGITIFFTGLSGAGKSTIANALLVKLLEVGGRQVTLLDGDLVRKNLSSGLGFSKEDRNTNIRRIGWVAAEIVRNGGIAICAPIAPYDSIRKEVRAMVNGNGFALVHVMTPLDVCEERDRKGLYAKARAGLIKEFTGISDPYEPPTDAELNLDTTRLTPDEAAESIVEYLRENGYLSSND